MFDRNFVRFLFLSIALQTMVSENANAVYSSQTGRFLNRDPIGYSTDDQLLYSFCRAKALKRTDPSGNVPYTIDDQPLSNLNSDARVKCEDFLGDFLANPMTNNWPDDAKKQLTQSPNIFCGDCYADPKIDAPSYSWGDKICNVCLDNTQGGRLPEEWASWLIHELTHCSRHYPCGKKDNTGPPTSVPPQMIPPPISDPRWTCSKCLKEERGVYDDQCAWLFPNDPIKRAACVEYGLCLSCKDHPCKGQTQWYKNCSKLTMPEIFPGVPSSGGYPHSKR